MRNRPARPASGSPRSWSTLYSMPWRRGSMTEKPPTGSSAGEGTDLRGHLRVEAHQDEPVVLGPAHAEVEVVVAAPRRPGRRRPGRCRPGGARAGRAAWPRRPGRRRRWRCRWPTPPRRRCPRATRATGSPPVQVGEAHGVALAAGGVGRVRQPAVVGADREVPDGEVVVPLGQPVLVQEDLLVLRSALRGAAGPGPAPAGRSRPAAVDGVAAALHGAAVVEPGALAHRHREVGLLDPGDDLVEQGRPGGRWVPAMTASV